MNASAHVHHPHLPTRDSRISAYPGPKRGGRQAPHLPTVFTSVVQPLHTLSIPYIRRHPSHLLPSLVARGSSRKAVKAARNLD
jgi:hypothetical protein